MFPAEERAVTVMECVPATRGAKVNATGSLGTPATTAFVTKRPAEAAAMNQKSRRPAEVWERRHERNRESRKVMVSMSTADLP